MGSFPDHFSGHAADYARFRPTYPEALFASVHRVAPPGPVWDVGTGNGQAAVALAPHGRRVLATDASHTQVAHATRHPRVLYAVAPAERPPIATGRVAAVTVGQALHWFRPEPFHAEVRRVTATDGVLVAWSYDLVRITPDVDRVVDGLYHRVHAWWPPERRHVEARYDTLPFPFDRIELPDHPMEALWSLEDVLGYCGTWSAVRRFRADRGTDPVHGIADPLREAWGVDQEGTTKTARWPLTVLAGRVP